MSHQRTRTGGFTAIELLIAMTMTLAVIASGLALARPAHAALRVQLESVDVTQRLRAAADALTRDILMAGSGLPSDEVPVAFYRRGASEGLTVRYVPSAGAATVVRSYYVKEDADANVYELRRTEGDTDLPVVDHIASVVFTCLDDGARLVPSCDDSARIRRVQVTLRVQAVMQHMRITHAILRVPDEEVILDVAPRSLQAGG